MNKIAREGLIFLLLLLFFTRSAIAARLGYVVDIPTLERESSAIIVARVLSVSDGGLPTTVSGESSKHAVCEVVRSFKGTDTGKVDVFFLFHPMAVGQDVLSPNSTAVLFLKKIDEGGYTFANRDHSKVPLTAFDPKLDEPQISIRERIGAQLRAQLKSDNAGQVGEALDWADYIGYVFSDNQLRSLAGSDNLDIQIASLTRLVTRNAAQAVTQAIEMLFDRNDLTDVQINDLAWSLDEQPDVVSLANAMRLARAQNKVLSRVGVRITAAIAKPSDIAELIECLDATDALDAKYLVIQSLGRLTGQQIVMPKDFFASPDTYIAYWKSWFASTKSSSQSVSRQVTKDRPQSVSEISATAATVSDKSYWFASRKAALIGIAAAVLLTIAVFMLRSK